MRRTVIPPFFARGIVIEREVFLDAFQSFSLPYRSAAKAAVGPANFDEPPATAAENNGTLTVAVSRSLGLRCAMQPVSRSMISRLHIPAGAIAGFECYEDEHYEADVCLNHLLSLLPLLPPREPIKWTLEPEVMSFENAGVEAVLPQSKLELRFRTMVPGDVLEQIKEPDYRSYDSIRVKMDVFAPALADLLRKEAKDGFLEILCEPPADDNILLTLRVLKKDTAVEWCFLAQGIAAGGIGSSNPVQIRQPHSMHFRVSTIMSLANALKSSAAASEGHLIFIGNQSLVIRTVFHRGINQPSLGPAQWFWVSHTIQAVDESVSNEVEAEAIVLSPIVTSTTRRPSIGSIAGAQSSRRLATLAAYYDGSRPSVNHHQTHTYAKTTGSQPA